MRTSVHISNQIDVVPYLQGYILTFNCGLISCCQTDGRGSKLFNPSGSGFNGFPSWHLVLFGSMSKTQKVIFSFKYPPHQPKPFYFLFTFRLNFLLSTGNMCLNADISIGLKCGRSSWISVPDNAASLLARNISEKCVKIAGWAWELYRETCATVWRNQCEPCIVSTFQGLDNEKHTVHTLLCCLQSWLV